MVSTSNETRTTTSPDIESSWISYTSTNSSKAEVSKKEKSKIPTGVRLRASKNLKKQARKYAALKEGCSINKLLSDNRFNSSHLAIQYYDDYLIIIDFENKKTKPYNPSTINNILWFDKNNNYIQLEHRESDNKRLLELKNQPRGKYPRLNSSLLSNHLYRSQFLPYQKKDYMLIDKDSFIKHRGEKLGIINKSEINYSDLKKVRKKIKTRFKQVEKLINKLKKIVSSVFDENNFEIYTELNFISNKILFFITVRYPNVTIKNSIENEHYIGDILVRFQGHQRIESESLFIERMIEGLRTTFTPYDLHVGYSHSHLQANVFREFSPYCIGGYDHMFRGISRDGNITDLELEGILLASDEFIGWESLEGGPFFRMESIFNNGNKIRFSSQLSSGFHKNKVGLDFINTFEEKVEILKPAFMLVNNILNEPKFIMNETLFISLFVDTFKDYAKELAIEGLTRISYYNESNGNFYLKSTGMSSWKAMQDFAFRTIGTIPPIYMNGKYIRPQLQKIDEVPDMYNSQIESFHPLFILNIGQAMLFRLQNKLLNKS